MLGGKRVRDAGKVLRENSSPVFSCATRLLSLIKRAHRWVLPHSSSCLPLPEARERQDLSQHKRKRLTSTAMGLSTLDPGR